jgi:hypothetical protein
VIKPTYLNIFVPDDVKLICSPTCDNSTVSSNAAKLIKGKLARLPPQYSIQHHQKLTGTSSLRLAIDAIVYAKLSELAIVANLSISETCVGLICETFEWHEIKPKTIDLVEEIQLEIGCLRRKQIGNHHYWYWRYYTKRGHQSEVYMGKDRGNALAKVKAIGIPDDANPKHRHRCKIK